MISEKWEISSILFFSGIFLSSSFQISYKAFAPCHKRTFCPFLAFWRAISPHNIDLPDPGLPKTKLCGNELIPSTSENCSLVKNNKFSSSFSF
ncbi:hypothetical protein [Leptospira biflexa]|uniref:hypothetical protein n=1 Tax=Leptospira biflexa TaxID=172 RepID=UPI00108261D9|nr:hypothetical protein [Leptospira biflexa]TGM38523.1 hypothetical protein EHQ80_13415 [Leptospira biflexa]